MHRSRLPESLPRVDPPPPRGTVARPASPLTAAEAWRLQPSEPVPDRIATDFQRHYGVDVSRVPVRRGAPAAEVVRAAGARAASAGGEVLLPQPAGPLDSPEAASLLAHELVHVVQRSAYGGSPPAESSELGRALEAEAVTAEWQVRDPAARPGFGPSPGVPASLLGASWQAEPPPVHQVRRAPAVGASDLVQPTEAPEGPDVTALRSELAAAVTARAPEGSVSIDDLLARRRAEQRPQAAPEAPASAGAAAPQKEIAARAQAEPVSTDGLVAQQRELWRDLRELRSLDASMRETVARGQADVQRLARDAADLRAWVARIPRQAVDMDRPAHLEELAGRLYDRIRSRIRQELLVDRERSGRLADLP